MFLINQHCLKVSLISFKVEFDFDFMITNMFLKLTGNEEGAVFFCSRTFLYNGRNSKTVPTLEYRTQISQLKNSYMSLKNKN